MDGRGPAELPFAGCRCYCHDVVWSAVFLREGGAGLTTLSEQPADAVPAPTQNFGTAGIKPLERPSPVTRAFMAVVAWVERLNFKFSKVGNPPIYDNAVFPWSTQIERDWRAIRAELDHVLTRKDDLPRLPRTVGRRCGHQP
jgi:hypothetical protein